MRAMVVAAVAALCTATSACLHEAATTCDDGSTCPPGLRCVTAGSATACVPPTCGNNVLDEGERCDDGNNVSGDGCPATCGDACGDGVLDPGELCDDGNTSGGDGCSGDCRSLETCGNGIVENGEPCDDGNSASHDGCSSKCTIEGPTWSTLATPSPRSNVAMTYDVRRDTLLMFGGELAYLGATGDTWEWDGAWHLRHPVTLPPARYDAAMTYDVERGRAVMFGGGDARLWEWDGGNWIASLPEVHPPPSSGSTLAYEIARRRTLLVGGASSERRITTTWAWDGAAWTELELDANLPPRAYHAMAYDPARDTTIVFGGQDDAGITDETWELAGGASEWKLRTPATRPPARTNASAVFDAKLGKIVVYGGSGGAGMLGDAWAWDGATWTLVAADGPPRQSAGFAYDDVRGQAFVFGGFHLINGGLTPDSWTNDLWSFDGTGWIDPDPPAVPPRQNAALGFDPLSGALVTFGGTLDFAGAGMGDTWTWRRTWSAYTSSPSPSARSEASMVATPGGAFMFGGIGDTGRLADTWRFANGAWSQVYDFTPPPTPRSGAALSYDPVRDVVVMFAGALLYSGNPGGDTWEWSPATGWLERTPASGSPGGCEMGGMAYDPISARTILFGCQSYVPSGDGSQTWAWDGATWTLLAPAAHPVARRRPGMALDPVRRRIVLFGGVNEGPGILGDTWEWDGTTWIQVTPPTSPPPTVGHAMTFNAATGKVAMFGGVVSFPGGENNYGDVSTLWEWDGTTWANHSRRAPMTARHRTALVTDAGRAETILFGGSDVMGDYRLFADTWRFTASGWEDVTPSGASPPGRAEHAMAYDPIRKRVVLFGGATGLGQYEQLALLGDTWEWDGASWLQRTAGANDPLARRGAAMTFDGTRNKIMLVCGDTHAAYDFAHYELDASGWNKLDVTGPLSRTACAVAYDRRRGRVVLFGGEELGMQLPLHDDVWEWDGTTWTERTPPTSFRPAGRAHAALVYDEARGHVVLFGGTDQTGAARHDAWEWDGTNWTPLADPDTTPPSCAYAAAALAGDGAQLVIYAGDEPTDRTWLLAWNDPGQAHESCRNGFDGDGDGKVGCADDDCAAVCGTCGNGTCDPLEACDVCPLDCGVCAQCGDGRCSGDERCEDCPGDCGACP